MRLKILEQELYAFVSKCLENCHTQDAVMEPHYSAAVYFVLFVRRCRVVRLIKIAKTCLAQMYFHRGLFVRFWKLQHCVRSASCGIRCLSSLSCRGLVSTLEPIWAGAKHLPKYTPEKHPFGIAIVWRKLGISECLDTVGVAQQETSVKYS